MWFLKLIGVVILGGVVAAAAFIYDAGWNEGRLMARLMGRDRLVSQCLPAVRAKLSNRGFTPTDVEVGSPVSIGVASGAAGSSRILSGPLTFTDGPNGQRVDGRLVCHVSGTEVDVDVHVDQLPLRAA